MFFDWLIIFLIWFILILLLISIVFYNRLRVREFYSSNNAEGESIIFHPSADKYYNTKIGTTPISFSPLYIDRNRSISGSLVLLTYSSNNTGQYYKIRVMNNNKQVSEGVYRIDPKLGYNTVNFSVEKGENRKLTFEIKQVDRKTNKVILDEPTNINLVKAWAYYY